jgi:hypothetical protein
VEFQVHTSQVNRDEGEENKDSIEAKEGKAFGIK